MNNDEAETSSLDFTANGVEFSPWSTEVENDQLFLGRLSFEEGAPLVTLPEEGLALSLPSGRTQDHALEATFVSSDKKAVIRFGFNGVIAFRVLDENGLLELWSASAATPRPAQSTFRARGHKWMDESFLVFLDRGEKARFSYFVATNDLCLEVVCRDEPEVTEIGPAVVTKI